MLSESGAKSALVRNALHVFNQYRAIDDPLEKARYIACVIGMPYQVR